VGEAVYGILEDGEVTPEEEQALSELLDSLGVPEEE